MGGICSTYGICLMNEYEIQQENVKERDHLGDLK
jgi:hypothetical protein